MPLQPPSHADRRDEDVGTPHITPESFIITPRSGSISLKCDTDLELERDLALPEQCRFLFMGPAWYEVVEIVNLYA